jgi:hypothetical protein
MTPDTPLDSTEAIKDIEAILRDIRSLNLTLAYIRPDPLMLEIVGRLEKILAELDQILIGYLPSE